MGDTRVSHYQGDIVAYRDGAVIIAGGNLGTNYDGLSEVYSPGTSSWSDLNTSETVAWLTEFASVHVNGNVFKRVLNAVQTRLNGTQFKCV